MPKMKHREKIDIFIYYVNQYGSNRDISLIDLLSWKLGINSKPLMLMKWWSLFLLFGTVFSLIVLIPTIRDGPIPGPLGVPVQVFYPLLNGIFCGTILAYYIKRKAKRLGLKDWESFPSSATRPISGNDVTTTTPTNSAPPSRRGG